jgi:protoheme IX farnesyltransferase
MLGFAATGEFGIEAGTLFLIQFLAISFWALMVLYEDYEKAGFFMLPTGKKDKGTALQVILYTVWLIALYLFLFYIRYLYPYSSRYCFVGIWMLFYAVKLYKLRTKAARTLCLLVFLHYIITIIYIFDKF